MIAADCCWAPESPCWCVTTKCLCHWWGEESRITNTTTAYDIHLSNSTSCRCESRRERRAHSGFEEGFQTLEQQNVYEMIGVARRIFQVVLDATGANETMAIGAKHGANSLYSYTRRNCRRPTATLRMCVCEQAGKFIKLEILAWYIIRTFDSNL